MIASTPTGPDDSLPPVVDDMSAYVIAGAISADDTKFERDTEGRTPSQGIQDGVDAEKLGFRRVFLSERWDIKEADVILAAIGARTTRIELATGMIVPTTRHPWMVAALGATMHASFGHRFILGLGRGEPPAFKGMGIKAVSFEGLVESANITRKLWAGERVAHDGELGSFDGLQAYETCPEPFPPIWLGGFCLSKGAAAAASAFDGVILPPMFTPHATAAAVKRIREACERIGRDPASVRIVQPVVTAPDLDDVESQAISVGRLVTYLLYPKYGDILATENGWDLATVQAMRQHPMFTQLDRIGDHVYHRHQLIEGPGALLPADWIRDSSAVGAADDCVASLQRFLDAGADEVATYGSTPRQNAELIAKWRTR